MKNIIDPFQNQPATPGATVPRLQKRALRQALLAARDALPPQARVAIGRAMCRAIEALPCFQNASALLLYYPMGSEIDLLPLAKLAAGRGIPVAFPACRTQTKTLVFRLVTKPEGMKAGAYGIPEPPETAPCLAPDQNALCLLPALAYDQNLCRLGYGGGYYDRFLQDFPGTALGVCAEQFLLDLAFAEPHDLPADLLVTETRVLKAENPRKKNVF